MRGKLLWKLSCIREKSHTAHHCWNQNYINSYANKDKFKKYFIDTIFRKYGHTVLRLPLYHPNLNYWNGVGHHERLCDTKKVITWNVNHVTQIIIEKADSMGHPSGVHFATKWRKLRMYRDNDVVIDNMTEEFVIHLSENDSDEYLNHLKI